MDEKFMAREVNLRGEDVKTLRRMLEYRFPPPNTAPQAPSTRPSQVSVLEREETPWWWSPSTHTQTSEHESKVLDSRHLLSSEMLARTLALSAQRTHDKLYTFVQSLASQRGADYDEMIDAWDGFGLDFMPRIPKQLGNPPDASYFCKAKIERDIQNVHIVLQYFAVLIEEVLHDQEKFNSPLKTKWQEVADMLRQQVIRPYARLSPAPGRPSGLARFLYGLTTEPLSTPHNSLATASAGLVDVDADQPPRGPASSGGSSHSSAEVLLSFDLPLSMAPPSSARQESPPAGGQRHRLPRTAFDSSPSRAYEVPGDESGAQPVVCCALPGRAPFPSYPPDLLPPAATAAAGSRSKALPAAHKHPTYAPSYCLSPPKPQLPPPEISDLFPH